MPAAAPALADQYDLTLDEAAERLERQPQVRDLRLAALTALEPIYAGLWVDHADAGTVNIAVTNRQAASSPVFQRALNQFPRSDLIRWHEHPVTVQQASEATERFLTDKPGLEDALGIALPISGVMYPATLSVDALTSDPSSLRRVQDMLTERYAPVPVKVDSVEFEEVPVEAQCVTNREGCGNPLRGGLRLEPAAGSNGQACTHGFNATNGSSVYVLTAGHCYANGAVVDYRDCRIGGVPQSVNEPGGAVDVARIFDEPGGCWGANSRWIISPQQGDNFQVREVAGLYEYGGGDYICHNGMTTNAGRCGEVVSNSTNCADSTDQIRLRTRGALGDSGASIYDDQTLGDQTGDGTNLGTAVAILKAISSTTVCGTHIIRATARLGVSIIIT